MKFITIKTKGSHFLFSLVVIFLLLAITVVAFFSVKSKQNISLVSNRADMCKIRNDLLITAMDFIGVCSACDAVDVWAKGVIMRNGAMQYSVMTKQLKSTYQKQLESTFPNWVTGVSSPWVSDYVISEIKKISESTVLYTLSFSTKTSEGFYKKYKAELTVVKNEDFYRISSVSTDKEFYVYTGFTS